MQAKRVSGPPWLAGNALLVNALLFGVGLVGLTLVSEPTLWTRCAVTLVGVLLGGCVLYQLTACAWADHLMRWWRHGNGDRLNVRHEHEMRLKAKTPKYVTPAAFRQAVKEGRQWTIINGSVYDISGLTAPGKHPGGNFLADFVGIDASLSFYTAHIKSDQVWRRLRVSWMGYLTQPDASSGEDTSDLMCSRDKALHKLIEEFAAEGLFAYPLRHWLWDMQGPVLFLISLLTAHWCIQGRIPASWWGWLLYVASIGCGAFGALLGQYLCHDVGHQSAFETKAQGKRFCKWFAVVWGGIDWSEGAIVHDAHHAFPHVVGRDKSLDTTPLVYWHPAQLLEASLDKLSTGYATWASFMWFFVILWIYMPLEVARSVVEAAKRRDALVFGGIMARMAAPFLPTLLFGASWHYASWIMLVGEFGFASLALCASLNHFLFDAITVDQYLGTVHQTSAVDQRLHGFVALQAGVTENHNRAAMDHGLHGFTTAAAGDDKASFPSVLRRVVMGSWDAVVSCWVGHFNYHIEHHLVPYMPRRNLHKVTARCRALVGEDLYASTTHAEGVAAFLRKLRRPF